MIDFEFGTTDSIVMDSKRLKVTLKPWTELNQWTFTHEHIKLEKDSNFRETCLEESKIFENIKNLDEIIEKALLSAGILKPKTEVRSELFRSRWVEIDIVWAGIDKSNEWDTFFHEIWS